MLVVRVHPEIRAAHRLRTAVVSPDIWKERFEDINAFERHLHRSGVMVRKFFLHVSKKRQRSRFLERIDQPAKNWKFSARDVEERARWREYMAAYEDMIRHTATPHAPWYVVPADRKWFTQSSPRRWSADEGNDLVSTLDRASVKTSKPHGKLEREKSLKRVEQDSSFQLALDDGDHLFPDPRRGFVRPGRAGLPGLAARFRILDSVFRRRTPPQFDPLATPPCGTAYLNRSLDERAS